MATWAYLLFILSIGAATACGILQGRSAWRAGKAHLLRSRAKSPTIYIFSAYLILAGLLAPRSEGEASSPLLWLGLAIPVHYLLASLSALQAASRARPLRLAVALLHALSVASTSFLILSFASPTFVPNFLH